MTLRNYIIIAALGSVLAVRAQEEPAAPVFRPPFDFPLTLSGNFGELRSNHFHGGVDFKTQGEVGKPIHCIADGYVSRVLVTPGGYGQAIFITHPNGYTSVYGHVLKFASAVAKVVEEYQYRHETFAVDLKFEPHQVSFKAGEIIALSGNEGYSFGPHLHMEIRRTDTGELIDPLQFYTDKIKDTTPPRASMIMLYPQRGAGVVEGSQRKKSISVASLGQPVSAWGKIAAGIKAYDYMDGTHNNYGVRSVVLYVDTTEVFRSTVDGVLPEENRMINAWTDYEENVKRHNWVMRSQILPGNSLRMLQANDEGGVVTIDEERDYRRISHRAQHEKFQTDWVRFVTPERLLSERGCCRFPDRAATYRTRIQRRREPVQSPDLQERGEAMQLHAHHLACGGERGFLSGRA